MRVAILIKKLESFRREGFNIILKLYMIGDVKDGKENNYRRRNDPQCWL